MQLLKLFNQTDRSKSSRNLILFWFRVILGLALFVKGINFARNQEFLHELISNIALLKNLSFLNILIPSIHIIGGFFIIIGVYTRLVILTQLPIIFSAIILLLISRGVSYYREIAFALTIFILLISYLKFGDGFYSWKNLIKNEKNIV